jgi:hypothetical protein
VGRWNAIVSLQEELRIKRAALGNVHPLLAMPLASLAHLYATANKQKKAEQAYLVRPKLSSIHSLPCSSHLLTSFLSPLLSNNNFRKR